MCVMDTDAIATQESLSCVTKKNIATHTILILALTDLIL